MLHKFKFKKVAHCSSHASLLTFQKSMSTANLDQLLVWKTLSALFKTVSETTHPAIRSIGAAMTVVWKDEIETRFKKISVIMILI